MADSGRQGDHSGTEPECAKSANHRATPDLVHLLGNGQPMAGNGQGPDANPPLRPIPAPVVGNSEGIWAGCLWNAAKQ